MTALTGAGLLAIAIAFAYFDELTRFHFDFIDDHYEIIGIAGLLGLVLAFVGCIGWARHLEKMQRLLMAVIAFFSPWAILLIGYSIDGLNVHGASAPVMLLVLPATLLAFILLLMAELAARRSRA